MRWVRDRDIDLQNLKLEYEGLRGDDALGRLVKDENEDMATFYALRSEARDAKVNGRYGSSTTLIEASERGYLEVAKCLIDRGADVNKADNGGETPLYRASRNGHLEVVRSLLDAKAEVNKADVSGRTPLAMALSENFPEIVAVLLEVGGQE